MASQDQDYQKNLDAIIKEYTFVTQALKIQKESKLKFLNENRKNCEDRYECVLHLKKLMQVDPYISKRDTYKIIYGDNTPAKLSSGVKMIYRKKCIIVEDSGKPFFGNLHKKSSILSCRNPFRADQENVNYDMDSEDEWAEANGEDLGEDNKSDEEEEDPEENQGFIVEDDYLSDCELNLSENSDVEKEKERRKVII